MGGKLENSDKKYLVLPQDINFPNIKITATDFKRGRCFLIAKTVLIWTICRGSALRLYLIVVVQQNLHLNSEKFLWASGNEYLMFMFLSTHRECVLSLFFPHTERMFVVAVHHPTIAAKGHRKWIKFGNWLWSMHCREF